MASHDLGVLLVHGIGRQSRVDTLVRFGEPLCRWMANWTAPEGDGPWPVPDVQRASLDPAAHDVDHPAHAEFRFDAGQNPRRWLLAEGWWADSFLSPSFFSLILWSLLIAPLAFLIHYSRRMASAVRLCRRLAATPDERVSKMKMGPVSRPVWAVVREFFTVLFSLLLLFLLEAALFVLLVLGIIPIPAFRSFLFVIQQKLTATIGDSLVLLESPVQLAAMVSKVGDSLRWLAERCDKVAVVAHSQGAALAYLTLGTLARENKLPASLKLLVTVGAGIPKLFALRDTLRLPGRRWSFLPWMFALAGAAFWTALAYWVFGVMNPVGAGLIAGIALFVLYLMVYVGAAALPDLELEVLEGVRWREYYAGRDPVPGGPFLTESGRILREERRRDREVHNAHSVLVDHTTYFANEDEFVTLVAGTWRAATAST